MYTSTKTLGSPLASEMANKANWIASHYPDCNKLPTLVTDDQTTPFSVSVNLILPLHLLWFNLIRVEICELRPEVVTKDDGVLVHYLGRTNV